MDGKKDPWALVGLVSWRTSPSKSFTDANTCNKACKEGKSLIYYNAELVVEICTKARCSGFVYLVKLMK